jgi:opacity protein-like surface antigen
MKRFLTITWAAACGCLSLSAAEQSQWKHSFTAYFLGAAMDGTAGIGNLEVPVDMSFSDIVDNLELGAMAHYRAEKAKLSLNLDVIYMGLGGTVLGLGDIDFDQWLVEGTAGWRTSDKVELFAGVRYNDIAAKVAIGGSAPMTIKRGESWYDPIVGARLWLPLSGAFSCIVRGDVGGFGVGSDFSWQLGAYLRYATTSNSSLLVGYRYLDMDYESGEGAGRFLYDMTIQGPAVGFNWNF